MKIDKKKLIRWPALPALVMCIIFFFINVFCTTGFLQKHVILSFLSSNIPLVHGLRLRDYQRRYGHLPRFYC